MEEKGPKRTRNEDGVLGTLPSTRPERIGRPRRAGAKPVAKRARKPAAVTPACPPLRPAHEAPHEKPIGAPTGTELVTTTIRAAGELAQIGFTVGGQMLKRTIGRIPRP